VSKLERLLIRHYIDLEFFGDAADVAVWRARRSKLVRAPGVEEWGRTPSAVTRCVQEIQRLEALDHPTAG
jgi:hypothetical protein